MLGVSLLVVIALKIYKSIKWLLTRLYSLLHWRLQPYARNKDYDDESEERQNNLENFPEDKDELPFLCIIYKFNMEIVTFKFTLGCEN